MKKEDFQAGQKVVLLVETDKPHVVETRVREIDVEVELEEVEIPWDGESVTLIRFDPKCMTVDIFGFPAGLDTIPAKLLEVGYVVRPYIEIVMEELPALFAAAFENVYLTNVGGPEIQNKWMGIAMADEAFRGVAKNATDRIRSREGDSIPDPIDSAFLRGVAMGLMTGYRIREMQEEAKGWL